jgi:hypothetical protein
MIEIEIMERFQIMVHDEVKVGITTVTMIPKKINSDPHKFSLRMGLPREREAEFMDQARLASLKTITPELFFAGIMPYSENQKVLQALYIFEYDDPFKFEDFVEAKTNEQSDEFVNQFYDQIREQLVIIINTFNVALTSAVCIDVRHILAKESIDGRLRLQLENWDSRYWRPKSDSFSGQDYVKYHRMVSQLILEFQLSDIMYKQPVVFSDLFQMDAEDEVIMKQIFYADYSNCNHMIFSEEKWKPIEAFDTLMEYVRQNKVREVAREEAARQKAEAEN